MAFDLLLHGGEVIDPGGGLRGRLDVGVRDGRIAAVAAGSRGRARGRGLRRPLVVPGLVDLHTHVLHDLSFWGIEPDRYAPAGGSTTWVDAGSAGGYAISGLRRFVAEPARVRVLAFLNVSCIGLVARSWELANEHYLDEELCARMAAEHAGFVVGIKARIDRDTVGGLGIEPLRAAVRVAERAGLPVMAHVARRPAGACGGAGASCGRATCSPTAPRPPRWARSTSAAACGPSCCARPSAACCWTSATARARSGSTPPRRWSREGLPLIVSSDAHQLSVPGADVRPADVPDEAAHARGAAGRARRGGDGPPGAGDRPRRPRDAAGRLGRRRHRAAAGARAVRARGRDRRVRAGGLPVRGRGDVRRRPAARARPLPPPAPWAR